MKAVRYAEPEHWQLADLPDPEPGPGEVRIRVRATGVCGSVTRCGMGYCQGRVCGPALQQAVAVATGRGLSAVGDLGTRPLISPVTLGTIAAGAPPAT